MTGILLSETDRRELLARYRRSADPDARLRAHILLLLDAGHPWATISTVGWVETQQAFGLDSGSLGYASLTQPADYGLSTPISHQPLPHFSASILHSVGSIASAQMV